MIRKIFGYALIVLGVLFVFGFIASMRSLFSIYESPSVDNLFLGNYIVSLLFILVNGLIFIYRGTKWSSREYNPTYQYGKVKIVFGNLFYMISYFTLLTTVITALEFYHTNEKIITPVIFVVITLLLFKLGQKWTKKKKVVEIDKIGEE